MKICYAYCLASTFDFSGLKDFMQDRYRLISYKDAIHVQKSSGDAIIFEYGALVSWSLTSDELKDIIMETRPFHIETLKEPIIDEFSFSSDGDSYNIHSDHITLTSSTPLQKIAASHSLAQSVKLSTLEQTVQNTIDETAYIPKSIAENGYTRLSRKEISKMRGELFLVKSNIHLNFDLLDTPEFFWEYPELQDVYNSTANYLEVNQRIDVLNKKLNIIHELFNMLSDEHMHKHSSTLEWIIIWLIAIEIVIFLAHDIFSIV